MSDLHYKYFFILAVQDYDMSDLHYTHGLDSASPGYIICLIGATWSTPLKYTNIQVGA